jgi:D-psicose/D-tagatose/L-ribulose 3-epimerase
VRLGMNMLLWSTDVTGPEYDAAFRLLKEIGYDGVEVPIFDREVDKYAELGERLRAIELEPIAVSALPGDEDAAGSIRAILDSAAALGASLLCGPLEAQIGVFSGAAPTDSERVAAVDVLREVAPYADERGVTIALEYLNRFELYLVNTAADLASLVRAVDHPRIRMMYDTFHAHIEEKDPRVAIHSCADVLVHVHLSENDRSTPGTGQVAWDATFTALREIGYDGWVCIEAFGDALPDLAAATRIWRRMFESEEQLARDGAAFVRSALGE